MIRKGRYLRCSFPGSYHARVKEGEQAPNSRKRFSYVKTVPKKTPIEQTPLRAPRFLFVRYVYETLIIIRYMDEVYHRASFHNKRKHNLRRNVNNEKENALCLDFGDGYQPCFS
jgi:hypothetical protein